MFFELLGKLLIVLKDSRSTLVIKCLGQWTNKNNRNQHWQRSLLKEQQTAQNESLSLWETSPCRGVGSTLRLTGTSVRQLSSPEAASPVKHYTKRCQYLPAGSWSRLSDPCTPLKTTANPHVHPKTPFPPGITGRGLLCSDLSFAPAHPAELLPRDRKAGRKPNGCNFFGICHLSGW